IVSDNLGGAIIAWQDHRDGVSTRVYAKRATESDLAPICSVDPLMIDLAGTVMVGSSRDTTFTIENLGVGLLVGTVSEDCDQFQIISGGSYSLSNGQSQVVTVRFEPTAPGTFNCGIETGADICGDVSITAYGLLLPPDSVIYVDADATGGSGGSSWTNAFTELSDALTLAPSCPNVNQIWVAEGTYRPTAGTERSATFQMQSGLGIYGGFAGMETARDERSASTHVTILSGDIGTAEDASDNSYHVVTGSYADSTAVLDGFTVTAGNAGGEADDGNGGGMFNDSGSPTIANVQFRGNEAQSSGGGLFNGAGCSPKLVNVLFVDNAAQTEGGGIYNASSLTLVNASFSGNSAGGGGGGGICNASGSPVITNVIMWGDTASCFEGHENCNEIINYSDGPNVSYSLIKGSGGSAGWDLELGTDGGNNIDADPLYYGAEAGDLRILVGSPAVDAGNSAVPGLPATDIAGNARIQGSSVDMGAYEGQVYVFFNYARMDSLVDVPDDQGSWLRIYFTRSALDDTLEQDYPIARYDVHRRVDNPGLLASIRSEGEVIRENVLATLPGGDKVSLAAPSPEAGSKYVRYADRYYLVNEAGASSSDPWGTWEVVGNVSAEQKNQYIRLVPTLADSSATITWSVFYISAHTTTPSVYFDSPPDSGYSVDNIAPGVPDGFVVEYNTGGGNHLSWYPCMNTDFQYFRVYRDVDPDFVPGLGNLVYATAGTEWNDPDYDISGVYYKITALDHAGNESAPRSPQSVTGVDDNAMPRVFALHQNVPNPFNPVTVIRYDVPASGGMVTVKVYDVSGRLVRTLVDGAQSAGQHTVRWDGRNDNGQSAASGIYFCRMAAPKFVEKRKMVLLR
ncbi:MAG: FlgD immunoglobulin-like domain containing protein, partial [Candidatus Krumholzibacteria bacterium]|nr:FlgD immunoglobulin-like domain containing protein [Candidatus Krumholzibacteria bacterium]